MDSTISVMSEGVLPHAISEGLEILCQVSREEKQRQNTNNSNSWAHLYYTWLSPSLEEYVTALLSLLLNLCKVIIYNDDDAKFDVRPKTSITARDKSLNPPKKLSNKKVHNKNLRGRGLKTRSASYTCLSGSTFNIIQFPILELQVSIDNHTMLSFPYEREHPRHQQILFESVSFILLSLLKAWKRVENCGEKFMNILLEKNALVILLKVLNMPNPNLMIKQKKPSRSLRDCDVFSQKIWGKEKEPEFQSMYDTILATAASRDSDSTLMEKVCLESQLRIYNGFGNVIRLLQKLVKSSPRHAAFLTRLNSQQVLRSMLDYIMEKTKKSNDKKESKKRAKAKRLQWKGTLGRERKKKQMRSGARTPKRKRMSLASKQEDDAPRARGRTIDADHVPMDQTMVAERNTAKDTVALYILKLLKTTFRYIPEDWRMGNMDVVTQIFHNVRTNLYDDWISPDSTQQLREDVMHMSDSGRMRKRTI